MTIQNELQQYTLKAEKMEYLNPQSNYPYPNHNLVHFTLDGPTKLPFYLYSVDTCKHAHETEVIRKLKMCTNEVILILPRRALDAKSSLMM